MAKDEFSSAAHERKTNIKKAHHLLPYTSLYAQNVKDLYEISASVTHKNRASRTLGIGRWK